ncbi:MAG: DUF3096 domain-containing protein [Methyloceanibacter sp.]
MDPVLLNPLIALVAGVLILLMPRILNYVVAIYLIAIGIIGLAQHLQPVQSTDSEVQDP